MGEANNWTTREGYQIKNLAIVRELREFINHSNGRRGGDRRDRYSIDCPITCYYVPGHSFSRENRKADRLAYEAARRQQRADEQRYSRDDSRNDDLAYRMGTVRL